ncbi:3173_t:CDS:2, partial [Gigaspora margarita]
MKISIGQTTFETVADVLSRDEEQLCGTLKISAKDAAELVHACVQVITCSLYPPKTALQLLNDAAHCMLSTGDTEIDKILGGGILSRGITEIVGESGTGKTQLCLQFCLTVQFPKELGGLDGGAVYISTNGMFQSKRFNQLTNSIQLHHSCMRNKDLTDNVHCVTVYNFEVLRNIVYCQLPVLLSRNNIRLVIIDTITAVIQDAFKDFRKRAIEIFCLSAKLKEISDKFNTAIICVNQVTSDALSKEGFYEPLDCDDKECWNYAQYYKQMLLLGDGMKIPALGLSWSSVINTRISLSRPLRTLKETICTMAKDPRVITVMMAPHAPKRAGQFYIDNDGLHGVVCN